MQLSKIHSCQKKKKKEKERNETWLLPFLTLATLPKFVLACKLKVTSLLFETKFFNESTKNTKSSKEYNLYMHMHQHKL